MKSPAYWIKIGTLSILLLFISFFLSANLLNYAQTQDYFTPEGRLVFMIGASMLVLSYVTALTTGAWNKWEQYLFIPFPIATGILAVTLTISPLYALALFALVYALISYNISRSNKIIRVLIKFIPGIILRPMTKGLFLVTGIVAVTFVLLQPALHETINIGERLGEIASQQVSNISNSQGIIRGLFEANLLSPDFIKNEVSKQVNAFVEPYRDLLTPLVAVIVFLLIQALSSIVYLIYSITLQPLFWLARKTGFLKVTTQTVSQEVITF